MHADARAGDRTPWVWIGLLTAAAAVLRAIGLNGGLWFDEIATLTDSVRLPLATILTDFPSNNQHTFFSVLAHVSIALFGEHAWSLRLPSLLFGVASVPVLYLFAREFCDRREALLACLLLTTSYHHVWFSQNARGYSALAFLILLGSWLLLRLIREGRMRDAIWYAIAAALGVYTHLTMVFSVAAHAVLCAAAMLVSGAGAPIRSRVRVLATAFALSGVLTLLLYSPMLLDMKQFFVDAAKPAAVATPGWAVMEMIKGLRIGLGAGLAAVAAGALFAAGLWSYYRQSPFVAGLFVLPGVVTVGATVALGRPIFPRFVFFLIGFAFLIVVRGALELARLLGASRARLAGTALVWLMAAVSVVALVPNYRYPKQDYEGAMRYVDAQRQDPEPIVAVGLMASDVYRDYYGRDWPWIKTLDEFQAVRAQGRRVWVLYTLPGYIEHDTPDLWAALQRDCSVAAAFRGTVGYGDVVVCTAPPVARRP